MARKTYRIQLTDQEFESLIAKSKSQLGILKQGQLSRFIQFISKELVVFLDRSSKEELKRILQNQRFKYP